MELIAIEVRARRKQRNLSQQALAELAGVSVNFVKALEKGNTNIRLDLLLRVLDLFGIEIEAKVKP